jgi:hypothetical protein
MKNELGFKEFKKVVREKIRPITLDQVSTITMLSTLNRQRRT